MKEFLDIFKHASKELLCNVVFKTQRREKNVEHLLFYCGI
jgi:hypothetical protein